MPAATAFQPSSYLAVLRKLFTDPRALKPGQSAEAITRQAAEHFGRLADGLRQRGIDPRRAAHFLMKLMFCMFAEMSTGGDFWGEEIPHFNGGLFDDGGVRRTGFSRSTIWCRAG